MSARYEVRVDVSGIVDTQTQGDDWDRYCNNDACEDARIETHGIQCDDRDLWIVEADRPSRARAIAERHLRGHEATVASVTRVQP